MALLEQQGLQREGGRLIQQEEGRLMQREGGSHLQDCWAQSGGTRNSDARPVEAPMADPQGLMGIRHRSPLGLGEVLGEMMWEGRGQGHREPFPRLGRRRVPVV